MQTNFGLRNSDIEAICKLLQKFPQIEQAVIFGSRAKGNFRQGSDVDIALKGKHLTLQIIAKVSFLLNEETAMPYKFDVLDYHSLEDPTLLESIDKTGIVLYENLSEKL